MTAVHLTRLWINDAADPSDSVAVEYWRDSTQGLAADGDVRVYAGGRRRNVRGPGAARTWNPVMPPLPLLVVQDILDRAGLKQWFRDPLGGKVLGVFRDPTVTHLGFMTTRRYGRVQHAGIALSVSVITGDEVPRG